MQNRIGSVVVLLASSLAVLNGCSATRDSSRLTAKASALRAQAVELVRDLQQLADRDPSLAPIAQRAERWLHDAGELEDDLRVLTARLRLVVESTTGAD